MEFTTFTYGIFLIIIVGVYWLLPHRWQNVLLFVGSCFFYAYCDWRFLALISFSVASSYAVTIKIEKNKKVQGASSKKYLVLGLIANIGILGFFKYFNFFTESVQGLMHALGINSSEIGTLDIILPIGISFYTFSNISYIVDVFRDKTHARRNILDVALYIFYFPKIVAGPIERANNFLSQIERPRNFDPEMVLNGILLICWGIFKKVVIANNLSIYAGWVFSEKNNSVPYSGEAMIAIIAFTIQIYADFSAYTDIARGSSQLFGINLMKNFNMPYLAKSFKDFWHKWHISLSTWMRDYVYISLGGNRCTLSRFAINIMVTMVVSGLWHGANWTFILWGGLLGALYLIEHLLVIMLKPFHFLQTKFVSQLLLPIQWAVVMSGVCFGWSLFRADTLSSFINLWKDILSFDGLGNAPIAAVYIIIYCIVIGTSYLITYLFHQQLIPKPLVNVGYVLMPPILAVVSWIFGADISPPFFYAGF